jgi:hypothetical protein
VDAAYGVVRGRRRRSTSHAEQATRRLHCRLLPVWRSRVRQHTRGPRRPWRHAGRQTGRRSHQREPDVVTQLPVARLVERHTGKHAPPPQIYYVQYIIIDDLLYYFAYLYCCVGYR